jgi:hypothetical protein
LKRNINILKFPCGLSRSKYLIFHFYGLIPLYFLYEAIGTTHYRLIELLWFFYWVFISIFRIRDFKGNDNDNYQYFIIPLYWIKLYIAKSKTRDLKNDE